MIREILSIVFFVLGSAIFLISVIGTFKFKYVLNRMHSQALGDTMGIFFCIVGGMIYFGIAWETLKLLLILVFLWMTGPVATHLIADHHVSSEVDHKNIEFNNLTGREFVRETEE